MEPLVPEEAISTLEDDAVALIAEANRLAGQIHPILRASIGDLVRSMNCYYSNLIEGHATHPRDIERALEDEKTALSKLPFTEAELTAALEKLKKPVP